MKIYIKKEKTFVCLKLIDKDKTDIMEINGNHIEVEDSNYSILWEHNFYLEHDFNPSSKQEFMVAYKEAMNSFHNF